MVSRETKHLSVEEFGRRHSGDYVELIDGRVEWLVRGGTWIGFIAANMLGISSVP